MNAIELLEQGTDLDARSLRMCDVIERQVQHLSRLVDDLLDVGRLTTGKLALTVERIDLGELVTRVVRSFEQGKHPNGRRILLNTQPVVVHGDPTRLEQIVFNLLDNAVKYTKAGGRIDVEVDRIGTQARLRIRDTGIGIAPELLPRIFELFTQGEPDLALSSGGLGIGLTLVRTLVEMHGGEVTASSAGLGSGSEFVVRLPAHMEAEARATRAD